MKFGQVKRNSIIKEAHIKSYFSLFILSYQFYYFIFEFYYRIIIFFAICVKFTSLRLLVDIVKIKVQN